MAISQQDEMTLAEYQRKYLIDQHNTRQRVYAKWRANLDMINRLKSIGLWPSSMSNPAMIEVVVKAAWPVDVTPADLPKLRTVFETLKDVGDYDVKDAEQGEVWVNLDCGMPLSTIRVRYAKVLPADSRCQIVIQTIPSASVVCGVAS